MQRIWLLVVLTGSLFLYASCGGPMTAGPADQSQSGGDGGSDMRTFLRDAACVPSDQAFSGDLAVSVTTDQACATYAGQYCTRLQTCNAFSFSTLYKDMAQCQARTKIVCELGAPLGGTSQSATNIMACGTALSTETCPAFLSGYNFAPAACRMPGTLAAGAACADDHQCASSYCQLTARSSCGKCVAKVSLGATCVVDEDCTFGATCFGQGTGRKCATPATAGGTCNGTDKPCQQGLFCGSGKCSAAQTVGSACTLGSATCDSTTGLYCDAKTQKCVATKLAQVGQACGFLNNTKVQCAGGSSCFASGQARQCIAAAADGAPCGLGSTSSGPGCLAEARCTTGSTCSAHCQLPTPAICR